MPTHEPPIWTPVALCRSSAVTAQIEEYDFPGFDKATSIAQIGEDRGAWFKDSEGNLLGILQQR